MTMMAQSILLLSCFLPPDATAFSNNCLFITRRGNGVPFASSSDDCSIHSSISDYRFSPIGSQLFSTVQNSHEITHHNITDDIVIVSRSKRSKPFPNKKKLRRKRFSSSVPATEEELAYHVQSVFRKDETDETSSLGSDAIRNKLDGLPALVLNADYQPLKLLPLSTWSWQDTVKAVFTGKVVVVDVYPDVIVRAVKEDMPVPSVIALREYAPAGKARPAFTRRNVFLRDGYRCQYCSKLYRTSDLSLDHVEPRCLGGRLTWENAVTSCRKCNGRKGSLRPSELHTVGMKLRKEPRCPSIFELANNAHMFVPRRVHPSWAPFLGIDIEEDVMSDDPSSSSNGNAVQKAP